MFDWELPEISTDNLLELVQSSEAENADLPNQLLFGIFLMATSYWEHRGLGRLGYLTPEFILKRLGTLAYRNYEPAQALVLRVYQFLETPLPGSIEGLLVFWLSNGVKTGSWVAGTDLKSLDEPEYKLAAGEFRNTGGYNTLLSPMTLLDNSVIGSDDPSIIISDRYDTLLHYASAFSGQTDLFERLLLHKSLPASINARNKVGETPLHRACMAGLSSRVLALLKNGADPKLLTGFPRISCLHWIFCFPLENMEEAARALVAGGANVHSTTLSSLPWLHFPFSFVRGSPLHWAVAASSPVAITTLLKLGADPELGNLADPYRYAGHVRILEMVSGANHTMYSRPSGPTRGLTALDMAAELTDHVALQCVIDHARPLSHTVDEEGYNPFHRLDSAHTARTSSDIPFTTQFFHGGSAAARFSALTKTVQALATLGFNINQVTTPQQTLHAQVGRTPLMLSIELGSLPTATALASHPSTNLETPNLTGETALMVIPMPNNLDLDFLHLLLDLGANPLAANSLGHNTVLRRCARMAITPRDLTAIDLLLNLGVDFSARFTDKSRSGYQRRRSAAALALRSHRAVPEMLQVLQKHVFASPRKTSLMENADAWGGSLLHYAAEAGYAEPVRALVENGARVNAEREVLVFRSGNEDGAVGGEGMEMETALDVARAGRRGKEIVSNYRSRRGESCGAVKGEWG